MNKAQRKRLKLLKNLENATYFGHQISVLERNLTDGEEIAHSNEDQECCEEATQQQEEQQQPEEPQKQDRRKIKGGIIEKGIAGEAKPNKKPGKGKQPSGKGEVRRKRKAKD